MAGSLFGCALILGWQWLVAKIERALWTTWYITPPTEQQEEP
jgi:hypothetical protein